MSEKPLLLSPAKTGILVKNSAAREYLLWILAALGALVVLVGAASLLSRLADSALGATNASFEAFAPAAAINDPSILAAVHPTATTTPIIPARLRIPAIGVDAAVEQVGKKSDGTMATPQNFTDVAWYALGSEPGAPGNAVIAGHVNNALTTSGVFEHLSDLKLGDYITLEDSSGKALVYRVAEVDEYPAATAPAASIFATTGPSQLVLITCQGDWVPSAHSYNERLVVIAQPVQ